METLTDLGTADRILDPGHGRPVAGRVTLDYDARILRRKRLRSDAGEAFMVDLPQTTSLSPGQAFGLSDGRAVEVAEAHEAVLRIDPAPGVPITRLAWHIGNRHCPCQIAADHLVIRADPVLEAMLVQLGASITRSFAPFRPEGGAYGNGRTFGHSH